MALLRSIFRNARWSVAFRVSAQAKSLQHFPRNGILFSNNNVSFGRMKSRELHRIGFTRGFACGAEAGEASEDEEDSGAANEREIFIPHALKPEEAEPFNKLAKLFMNDQNKLEAQQHINEWQQQTSDHKLSERMVVKLVRILISSHRERQADKLIHWVLKEKPVDITENILLLAILRAQRLRKWPIAKRIYARIPEANRTPAIRTAMVSVYSKMEDEEKAEKVLASFTPKTPQAFNSIINLHEKQGRLEKAAEVYNRLLKAGLKPSKMTLMLVLKHRDQIGVEIDESEAERILNEGIDEMYSSTNALYSALESMVALAYLGNAGAVESLWARICKMKSLPITAWAFAVKAFGILGNVEKLKELTKKFTGKKNREFRREFYPALAEAYTRNKMTEEVEEIIKRLDQAEELKGEARSWLVCKIYDAIIQCLVAMNEPERAMERMSELQKNYKLEVKCGPVYETVKKLMPIYSKRGDVEGAEALVALTNRVPPFVYNELLKTYIAAGKNPGQHFLRRMIKVHATPDDETHRLLQEAEKLPQSVGELTSSET